MSGEVRTTEMANARETINKAAQVVQKMKADAEIRLQLAQADAVFIVPDYGRAALIVGGAGGQGVLMTKNGDIWSGPAFYNIGSINIGAAVGGEAGSIAFLIMSDKAMNGFREENNFSLNADAGLTIANWSERGQASAGKGSDVIVWSDTKGLYGDLALSVTDIFWDDEANEAYYNQAVSASNVINGTAKDPLTSNALKSEFSAFESGSEVGTTPAKKYKTPMNEDKLDSDRN
ncbi:MAG: lipid-binding SYLF domain-containing protein [Chromatocurvus sp.]